ncbi:hypothetical protein GCM10028811_30950 [Uliginosibacterium sediminicola]
MVGPLGSVMKAHAELLKAEHRAILKSESDRYPVTLTSQAFPLSFKHLVHEVCREPLSASPFRYRNAALFKRSAG